MPDVAVVNSSPIIYLSRANYLHLLQLASPRVMVPRVVAEEIQARGGEDPGVRALASNDWLVQVETAEIPRKVLRWNLGLGESSVIAWALENPGSITIIDDLAGRRCAETFQIRLRGTLGLVLRARREGVIPAARPVLETLRTAGMYLSDPLLDSALAEVGE